MKTNHQRRFVDPGSFRDRAMSCWSSKESGAQAHIGNDFTKGKRGHARAVHGAKKYLRTKDRKYGKLITAKEVDDILNDAD